RKSACNGTCQREVTMRTVICVALLSLCALTPAAQEASRPMPVAYFHHILLNVPDPAAAIAFYTRKFDCERAKFAGLLEGVWAQKSWLLFNKVKHAPPWELTSGIWHFGWGAEDMKATYEKQLASGTKFVAPLAAISDGARLPPFFPPPFAPPRSP